MDPVAHAFSGSAAAAAGLRRVTPLATAALVLGAVAPDIDALWMFGDEFAALAHRRGLTHGIAAVFVLPLAIVPLLVTWDRRVRRRRTPAASPADPVALYWLSAGAVALHLAFDWINNYGIRLLMPFDSRWFYGDAVFVIDPWLWLLFGGASFVAWSARTPALAAWATLWLLLCWPVFTSELVGASVRALWTLGLVAMVALRWRFGSAPGSGRAAEQVARVAGLLALAYLAVSVAANGPARREVQAVLLAEGYGEAARIMVAPVPAQPLAGFVVAETAAGYVTGDWHWWQSPRLRLRPEVIDPRLGEPPVQAAMTARAVGDFLVWSRFPYAELAELAERPEGWEVRFLDARFAGTDRGIRGPSVRVDRVTLEVLEGDHP